MHLDVCMAAGVGFALQLCVGGVCVCVHAWLADGIGLQCLLGLGVCVCACGWRGSSTPN